MAKSSIPTVAELRKQGYKVRVFHRRRKVNVAGMIPGEFRGVFKELIDGNLVPAYLTANKGGATRVEITSPTGENLVGESKCSRSDMYCKKDGVKKAIARALGSRKYNERIHIGDRVLVKAIREITEDGEVDYYSTEVSEMTYEFVIEEKIDSDTFLASTANEDGWFRIYREQIVGKVS